MAKRIWPVEIEDKIVELRQIGKSRKDIAAQLDIPLSKVKTTLSARRVILPMEARQKNSREAKLDKNPNYMEDMRKRLTQEVIVRRNASIIKAYQNPELVEQQRQNGIKTWGSLSEEKKTELTKLRSGESSPAFKRMLGPLADSKALLQGYADTHNGIALGEYCGSKGKVLWQCDKGHEFLCIPNAVQQGVWCPYCANVGPSKGQLEAHEYIKTLVPTEDVLLSNRSVIAPMELDSYVPSRKFGFEYNGLFFHSSYFKSYSSVRHQKKALACRAAGVKLLAVYEDEWENKQNLIKAMIRWRLGEFEGIKLNARSLKLVRLDKNVEFKEFFERNHLDGWVLASWAYGLFLGDKLVMCASVRRNHAGETEIARLATDYDYSVRGGAARLVAAIKKEFKGGLVSYSNNRLSSGNVYEKLGFKKGAEMPPSYWYTDGDSVRLWRYKCKRVNDPEVLAKYPTEKEQALGGVFSLRYLGDSRPLYQIHDFGHQKWVL